MSKADKMFENLGFQKEVRKKQTRYFIKNRLLIPDSEIIFNKKYKWVSSNFNLDMQELQAINGKCKELKWIEEN